MQNTKKQVMTTEISEMGNVWGSARLLERDSSIFGFPVGWLSIAENPPVKQSNAFHDWVAESQCVVTGASVPSGAQEWLNTLQFMGFKCIDLSMNMALLNIKRRRKLISSATIRYATPEDHSSIVSIAASSFEFGRYHRDIQFPRDMANKRFAAWMADSLRDPRPNMRFYVMGEAGEATGFMFVELTEQHAQLQLGGVSITASNGLIGPMFFAGVLDALANEHMKTVSAKISAINTSVLNIYAALGFHAARPEFTLHYHLSNMDKQDSHY